jgi:hypothetical protein
MVADQESATFALINPIDPQRANIRSPGADVDRRQGGRDAEGWRPGHGDLHDRPSLLKLEPGEHTVTLGSLLLNMTGTFNIS